MTSFFCACDISITALDTLNACHGLEPWCCLTFLAGFDAHHVIYDSLVEGWQVWRLWCAVFNVCVRAGSKRMRKEVIGLGLSEELFYTSL